MPFFSTFILPTRSALWSSVLTSTLPIESIGYLTPPHSGIPEYQEAIRIGLPFSLADKPDSPFDAKTRNAWTNAEHIKAANAPYPRSIVDLHRMV